MLDKHASFDGIDDDDPNAMRAREPAGDDQLENFRALLVGAGMSEADIDEAARIGKGGAIGRSGTDFAARARASKSATDVARVLP